MRALLLCTLGLLSASSFAHERGNGRLTTVGHDLTGFDRIALRVPMDATIRQGPQFSIKVTTDENLQGHVEVRVEEQQLIVEGDGWMDPSDDSRVEIELPRLLSVNHDGVGKVRVQNVESEALRVVLAGVGDLLLEDARVTHLDVLLSGAGKLRIDVQAPAEQIVARLSGTGDLELERGQVQNLVAVLTGAGSLDAKKLVAQNGDYRLSGLGSISTTLAGGLARFEVSGLGSIDWWGEAKVRRSEQSGLGSIQHHD